MNFLDNVKSNRKALREAKREYRGKHFLSWLTDRISGFVFAGFLLLVFYYGGAGIVDGDESGPRWIGVSSLADGSWGEIVDGGYVIFLDEDEEPDEIRIWAKRKYLECSYDRFAGPVVRRYWIGQDVHSSRKLSRTERLEFENILNDYFGGGLETYRQESYDREMAKGVMVLSNGCPFSASDVLE